eukprot:6198206-Pleurochrysis_carterae.AAC.1
MHAHTHGPLLCLCSARRLQRERREGSKRRSEGAARATGTYPCGRYVMPERSDACGYFSRTGSFRLGILRVELFCQGCA